MKKLLLFSAFILLINICSGQVTQINNNKSLTPEVQLNPNLVILSSGIDQTLWVTDGTLAGTFQLTDTIKLTGSGIVLNGKYIFAGSTVAAGTEIFITDGTKSGTKLIKDIYPGPTGSAPDAAMALLNGSVYFTAATPNEGRELWRTDGTPGNTTLVKDIVPGPIGSIGVDSSELFSNGTYLLFDVKTAAEGNELWRSDGTAANTFLLKDINPGALSSNPHDFYPFNNIILFAATDAAHGEEVWTTNGTTGGTVLLKDINPGPDSSTYIPIEFVPGFKIRYPVFLSFHQFNNHLFFNANDGVHGIAIWVTDGTSVNTNLLKVVEQDTSQYNSLLLLLAINLPNKFMFTVSNGKDRFELWQSDGTTIGTQLFKAFPTNADSSIPFLFPNFNFNLATHIITYPLFHGNFFFSAEGDEGNELWISDGTLAGTHIVKDINPGPANGIRKNELNYLYTTVGLFFAANDGVHGNELWKTDGTVAGTSMVKDINPNAGNADPEINFTESIVNGKILFTATDGDDPNHRDLFVVDGNFTALPVQLLDFTVSQKSNDALLKWSTSQEINSKDFTIQSSDDAQQWKTLGTVAAAGSSSVRNDYSFTDAGVMNSGKSIVYYRLITTDIDGKTANSNIISLKLKGGQWNVQLLSNPVHDNVKVLLSGITGMAELSINDLSGKIVYKKQLPNQNGLISLPVNLQSGIYLLITKINNEMKTIKFIKE